MQTIRNAISRALVWLAAATAPADTATRLREVTRPIWRPE